MAIIVGYLLWIESGWAGMIGIAVVFVVVPLQCMCDFILVFVSLIKCFDFRSIHWKTIFDISFTNSTSNR